MKKIFIILLFVSLLAPADAHAAFLGIGGCSAAAAVEGAVSKATDVATSKIANTIGVGAGVLGQEVPVKDSSVRKSTRALEAKECIGDALGWALANGVLSAFVQSITDWVNNGFEGGPAFVTDLDQFLGQVADETALDFIEGTELGFLCSPFQLEIRLALAVQRQPFQERIRCSLGDVVDNADRFFSGDFSGGGGWPAWFRVHAYQRNNPYGAYALSLAELEVRIDSRRSNEKSLLTFGSGFFSKRECVAYEDIKGSEKISQTGEVQRRCTDWKIVTPGTQVNASVAKALGVGVDRLTIADEIDELINALFAQLAQKALTGVDGLRGLSSRSSSSARTYTTADGRVVQGSYLEALVNETDTGSVSGAKNILLANIESAIELEEAYRAALEQNIAALNNVDGSTFACYYALSAPLNGTGVLAEIRNASELEDLYRARLEASRAAIDTLEDIRDQAAGAFDANVLNDAADAYDAVLASGGIHSETETAELVDEASALSAIVATPDTYCGAGATP